jgi:hypothetical protein
VEAEGGWREAEKGYLQENKEIFLYHFLMLQNKFRKIIDEVNQLRNPSQKVNNKNFIKIPRVLVSRLLEVSIFKSAVNISEIPNYFFT